LLTFTNSEIGNAQLPKKLQTIRRHHTQGRWVEVAIALLVLAATSRYAKCTRISKCACGLARRDRTRRQEGLARLPAPVQTRIAKALLAVERDPFPCGCKKLRNRDGWYIRVGDYRVLYFADKKVRQIVVGVIGHRRDVYRN
jgi:mRNA interferase RelE/StbE